MFQEIDLGAKQFIKCHLQKTEKDITKRKIPTAWRTIPGGFQDLTNL